MAKMGIEPSWGTRRGALNFCDYNTSMNEGEDFKNVIPGDGKKRVRKHDRVKRRDNFKVEEEREQV